MKTPVIAAVLATLALSASPALAGGSHGTAVGYFYSEPTFDAYDYHRSVAERGRRFPLPRSEGYDGRAFARYDDVTIERYERSRVRTDTVTQYAPGAYVATPGYVGVPNGVAEYVVNNPVHDIYSSYPMRRGVRLPSNVYLRAIPGYADYSYTYVNGRGVAVVNGTREIAYVY